MSPLFGRRDDEAARERSAADRERDRIDRERRRAEREGRASDGTEQAPAAPDAAPAPPDPAPGTPDPMPAPTSAPAAPESAPLQPAPALAVPDPAPPRTEQRPVDPPGRTPEPAPRPATPPPPDDEEVDWVEPRRAAEPVAGPPAGSDEPQVADTARFGAVATEDRPLGMRRVGAPSVRDLPQIAGPAPRGVPTRRRGLRRFFWLIVLLAVVAAGWLAYKVFQPFAGDGTGTVRITVVRGSTTSDVGRLLADRGVIDSAFFFDLRARLSGRRGDLKAGTFTLKRDMSYVAAMDALTSTPAAAPVTRITIPEGRSISETAPLVRQTSLAGSYVSAARRNPRTIESLSRYGVPRGTTTLEGFLFPATYELKAGSSARDLVTQQLQAFRRAFNPLQQRRARRANLTPYDVVIIASMVEREAGTAKDRRLISAVIYNRLRQGMPLGIDATIRYRLGNWSRPLRQSELDKDSAYNTRKHTNLPPTPIGNPGLASIKAALDPANVNYLFYVVRPCGNGAHAFSATDAQFQQDVAAYNRKRDELGGKDPSRC